jgi:hypothetical protein
MEHALSTALGRRCGSAAYLSSRYNLQQLAASLLLNQHIINTTHTVPQQVVATPTSFETLIKRFRSTRFLIYRPLN